MAQNQIDLTNTESLRVVMFGLSGVGKTSLIHRFLFGKFDKAYIAMIEDDYRHVMTYNNHIIDVTILNTSGRYQFPATRAHAIERGQCFVLVYAVDNNKSFEELTRLYLEITTLKAGHSQGHSQDTPPIIFVGNKIDKARKRKVDNPIIQALLGIWKGNVEHIETSAKEDTNVSLLFDSIVKKINRISLGKGKKQPANNIESIREQQMSQKIIDSNNCSSNSEKASEETSECVRASETTKTSIGSRSVEKPVTNVMTDDCQTEDSVPSKNCRDLTNMSKQKFKRNLLKNKLNL